jgi:hypothetical protein
MKRKPYRREISKEPCPLCKGRKTVGAMICGTCYKSPGGRWFARQAMRGTATAVAGRTRNR